MFSFRAINMEMNDLINGNSEKSILDYKDANNKSMIPTNMNMKMYMVGAMYGINEKITLGIMQGFMKNTMEMEMAMNGMESESETEGLGDTSLSALYGIIDEPNLKLVGNLGLSLPVGSIDEEKNGMLLGYPMQLGSGSYGASFGATGIKYFDIYSAGVQVQGKTFLGRNDEGYRLGNEYAFTSWISVMPINSLSFSLRLERKQIERISGINEDMHTMMSTTHDTKFSLRRFDSVLVGANYVFRSGALKGHRLAFEYGKLAAFDVNDFQLAPNEQLMLGWQKAF
ncbi:MAG: hypothetical protein CME64_12750 [Halobacteriovoraceae bacterium]|nr:hypothetical protein [Halobacteriovoraceae bacterium]